MQPAFPFMPAMIALCYTLATGLSQENVERSGSPGMFLPSGRATLCI